MILKLQLWILLLGFIGSSLLQSSPGNDYVYLPQSVTDINTAFTSVAPFILKHLQLTPPDAWWISIYNMETQKDPGSDLLFYVDFEVYNHGSSYYACTALFDKLSSNGQFVFLRGDMNCNEY